MTTAEKPHWYTPMRTMESLGQTTAKATHLGELAERRAIHRGQYFTPDAVAALMWGQAMPAFERVRGDRLITVLDNSIGSGRLIQFASPDQHEIFGNDVDARCVDALGEALKAGGFRYALLKGGMEALDVQDVDVAIINPPFSVNLSSPVMEPYPCTSFGRFGPGTSASSEEYALHQALAAAQVVVALLPRTYALRVKEEPAPSRLVRVIHLPANAFVSENAEVATSILVFGPWKTSHPCEVIAWTGQSLGEPALMVSSLRGRGMVRFRRRGLVDDAPSITMAVTGDPVVRIVRNGRKLRCKFGCGFMEAKTMNAIYRGAVPQAEGNAYHRYPRGVRFEGQGVLDVMQHLAQSDAVASFRHRIVDVVRAAGGTPVVDPGIEPYLRKQHRRLERQRRPLGRWAFLNEGSTHVLPDQGAFKATARSKQLLDPAKWGSPLMNAGDIIEGEVVETEQGKRYALHWKGAQVVLTSEAVMKRFEVSTNAGQGWQKVEPGRLGIYRDIETALRKRMVAQGIDRWLWEGYQTDDLIEALIGRTGVAMGWMMGLGKSRLGAALCWMSHGRHNALVSEAHLVYELARELDKIGVPKSEWQIIERPEHLACLKRLNLVSYTRLRMAVDGQRPKHTYAKALRRRLHTVVCDEAHTLSHTDTQQTRALWDLSPRVRFSMSGTLIANYPRDLLPVLQWTAGDGTPLQPYGDGPINRPQNIASMAYVPRGIDHFRESFVSTEWVTNEFAEDMQQGAKREIPRIKDVVGFREWVAPMIKRRIRNEPDVTKYVKVKDPTIITHRVPFDADHLAHYLTIAEDFASWYRNSKREADLKGIQLNLMLILKRIQEVQWALNHPQQLRDSPSAYRGRLTSKQRWVIDRFDALVKQGRRIIVFAQSPSTIDLLANLLTQNGHDVVALHGALPPKKRMAEIEKRFRNGQAHLLCTYKANKTGLNLPEANVVLLYEHDWAPKTEDQAIARVVRPEQTEDVVAEHVEIEGSIDEYMAQMCEAKRMASAAGLDFGEQDDREFLHLDTILGRFILDLEERLGVNRRVLKGERHAA